MVNPHINYQVKSTSIEVLVGSTRFTNDHNMQLSAPDQNIMIAETSDILKFIIGKLKVNDLRAASKRVQKRLNLERELGKMRVERNRAQANEQQKDRRIVDLEREMGHLRDQLAALASKN